MKRYGLVEGSMLLALVFAAGCGRESGTVSEAKPLPALPDLFVAAPPEGTPLSIPRVRQHSRAGDAVLVEGRIMGMKEPFGTGIAVFTIGDAATLTPCNERGEGDRCPTPWDVCCDTAEARRNGLATVRVVGEDGAVIRRGLKGEGGLRELAWVTVSGKLAPESVPESLAIDAASIHVRADAKAGGGKGFVLPGSCCPGH